MTSFAKPVQRVTENAYNVLYSGESGRRPLVVKLCAGDRLEFREKGRRQRWYLSVQHAFRFAVKAGEHRDQTVMPLEA